MLDLRDLQVFVEVAELRSFAQAAAHLRTAQSAISRRVQRLEHLLGVNLLERHAKGVHVTEQGRVLLEKAGEIFSVLRRVELDMMAISEMPSGRVRIAFPPATGQVLAPIIVERFRKAYPRVDLQVREGFSPSIQDWLITGTVDMALLYNPEESPDVRLEQLVVESLYLISAARDEHIESLLENGTISMTKAFELPLILPGREHGVRQLIDRVSLDLSLHPNAILQVDGINIIKHMVLRRLGYTIFNRSGLADEIATGSLVATPIVKPGLRWRLMLASRVANVDAKVLSALRDIVVSEVQTLSKQDFWNQEGRPVRHAAVRQA